MHVPESMNLKVIIAIEPCCKAKEVCTDKWNNYYRYLASSASDLVNV